MNRRARTFAAELLAGAVIGVLGACGGDDGDDDWGDSQGSSQGPDVSQAGQVEYACALARHVQDEHGDADSWGEPVGDDADPAMRETASVASLLGGSGGFVLPEHEDLSELGQDLFKGVISIDNDTIEDSLDEIVSACQDDDLSASADVSHSAQIDYACALAAYVVDEHGGSETWDGIGDERAWHEAGSVAALVGALNGQILSDHKELSEAGKGIFQGVSRIKTDELDTSLDDFISACP